MPLWSKSKESQAAAAVRAAEQHRQSPRRRSSTGTLSPATRRKEVQTTITKTTTVTTGRGTGPAKALSPNSPPSQPKRRGSWKFRGGEDDKNTKKKPEDVHAEIVRNTLQRQKSEPNMSRRQGLQRNRSKGRLTSPRLAKPRSARNLMTNKSSSYDSSANGSNNLFKTTTTTTTTTSKGAGGGAGTGTPRMPRSSGSPVNRSKSSDLLGMRKSPRHHVPPSPSRSFKSPGTGSTRRQSLAAQYSTEISAPPLTSPGGSSYIPPRHNSPRHQTKRHHSPSRGTGGRTALSPRNATGRQKASSSMAAAASPPSASSGRTAKINGRIPQPPLASSSSTTKESTTTFSSSRYL